MPNSMFAKRAADALVYYFSLIAEKAGIRWSYDNDAEVREIVTNIIKAVGVPVDSDTPGFGRRA